MAERPDDLIERTQLLALASFKFYQRLPKNPVAQVPGVQFLRAATAVASNYRAARRARSRREFIAKLGVVLEECDEPVGWLELMQAGDIARDEPLLSEARQLRSIFGTALKTARRNQAVAKK
jgi:four helix bundle protein